jgi:hypothetical protein
MCKKKTIKNTNRDSLGKNKDLKQSRVPLRTSLKVRLQSFFPASGLAIGMSELSFFFSFVDLSVSLSLPISPLSPFSSQFPWWRC